MPPEGRSAGPWGVGGVVSTVQDSTTLPTPPSHLLIFLALPVRSSRTPAGSFLTFLQVTRICISWVTSMFKAALALSLVGKSSGFRIQLCFVLASARCVFSAQPEVVGVHQTSNAFISAQIKLEARG